MILKKLNSKVSKILQFVKMFASKDAGRPVLNAVHFSEKYLVAADGFKLVVVEKPEEVAEISGNYTSGKIKSGENYVELEEESGNFPAWEQIAPCLSKDKKEPVIRIGINTKLLVDALKLADPSKPVILSLYAPGSPMEISGHIKQGKDEESTPFYSVIMPFSIGEDKGYQPK